MKIEIISNHPAIEEQLKELEKKNDKEFAWAGFSVHHNKVDDKTNHLYVIPLDMSASLGFKMGRGLLFKRMKKVFKQIDPNVIIREIEKTEKDKKEEKIKKLSLMAKFKRKFGRIL